MVVVAIVGQGSEYDLRFGRRFVNAKMFYKYLAEGHQGDSVCEFSTGWS